MSDVIDTRLIRKTKVYVLELGGKRAVVVALNEKQARTFVISRTPEERAKWINEAICNLLVPGVFNFGVIAQEI